MSTDIADRLREKDKAVMECIRRGDNTVTDIKAVTTLSRREINYCFTKLEKLGLITVKRPDGWTERVVDGQRRKHRTSKFARLTPLGQRYFDEEGGDQTLGRYDAVEYEELVETVTEIEHEVAGLRQAFAAFRKQVLRELQNE